MEIPHYQIHCGRPVGKLMTTRTIQTLSQIRNGDLTNCVAFHKQARKETMPSTELASRPRWKRFVTSLRASTTNRSGITVATIGGSCMALEYPA